MDLSDERRKRIKAKAESVMKCSKFGELDAEEILMYRTLQKCCNQRWKMQMPHDLLMVIVLYSQGRKYEAGDECVSFPYGLFGDSRRCQVQGVLEDKRGHSTRFRYKVKARRGGGGWRVPCHHVFSGIIVIIDEEAFRNLYPEHSTLGYGDVLRVDSMRCEEVEVWSRKKERYIRKLQAVMACSHPKAPKEWTYRRDPYTWAQVKVQRVKAFELRWDPYIFVQAKWVKQRTI